MDEDELDDPNFGDSSSINRRAKQQALTLQHFRSRWRHEYLTSLREYHKTTDTNKQKVKVGEVVLIQDDTPRIDWKLAVVEELIRKEGMDLSELLTSGPHKGGQTDPYLNCVP